MAEPAQSGAEAGSSGWAATKSSVQRTLTVDEALRRTGGARGKTQLRIILVCMFQWLTGSLVAFIIIFSEKRFATDECGDLATSSYHRLGASDEFRFCGDRKFLKALTQSLFYVGWIVGVLIAGRAGDLYGRRRTFIWSYVAQTALLGGTALAPNYACYLTARILLGAAAGSAGLAAYILGTEWIDNDATRCFVGVFMYNVFYASGEVVLVCLALVHWCDGTCWWRGLTGAAVGVHCLLLPFLGVLLESPRWLLSHGEVGEAKALLLTAAKRNGRINTTLGDLEFSAPSAGSRQRNNRSWRELMKVKGMMKKTLSMQYVWFAASFGFYGLSQNAGSYSGNEYLNVLASGLSEIPGVLSSWIMLESPRIGRRRGVAGAFVLAGGACLSSILLSGKAVVGVALVGKVGMSAIFSGIYPYSAEIFPTAFRNAGMGSCSVAARLGSLLSPFFGSLFSANTSLIAFGGTSLLGGLLTRAFLPETRDQGLLEHVDEAANIEPSDDVDPAPSESTHLIADQASSSDPV